MRIWELVLILQKDQTSALWLMDLENTIHEHFRCLRFVNINECQCSTFLTSDFLKKYLNWQEAASLGIVPAVSLKQSPIIVDVRNLQVHTAEV